MNCDCNVEFIDKGGAEWNNKSVSIDYIFEIDKRDTGIKNITFALSRIGIGKKFGKGWEIFQCLDGYNDEEEEKEIEINLEDYKIIEDWQPAEHYGIKEIEIDEGKKEVRVYLYYLSKGNDY